MASYEIRVTYRDGIYSWLDPCSSADDAIADAAEALRDSDIVKAEALVDGRVVWTDDRSWRIEDHCFCPDDCNCHHPWRTNFCGCKAHAGAVA